MSDEQKELSFKDKLRNIFHTRGIKPSWFADKIGMSRGVIFNILHGVRKVPMKFWGEFIEFANGDLTLKDFIEEAWETKEFLDIVQKKELNKCEIKIKDSSKTKNEQESTSQKRDDEI